MATAADVARLVEGAGDYDEVIERCQNTNLSVETGHGNLKVGATVVVTQIGGNHRNRGYWVVYDTTSPERSKVKVRGKS